MFCQDIITTKLVVVIPHLLIIPNRPCNIAFSDIIYLVQKSIFSLCYHLHIFSKSHKCLIVTQVFSHRLNPHIIGYIIILICVYRLIINTSGERRRVKHYLKMQKIGSSSSNYSSLLTLTILSNINCIEMLTVCSMDWSQVTLYTCLLVNVTKRIKTPIFMVCIYPSVIEFLNDKTTTPIPLPRI